MSPASDQCYGINLTSDVAIRYLAAGSVHRKASAGPGHAHTDNADAQAVYWRFLRFCQAARGYGLHPSSRRVERTPLPLDELNRFALATNSKAAVRSSHRLVSFVDARA